MTRPIAVDAAGASFAGAHLGLGMTVRLVAYCEDAVGRWPSLVVDAGAVSVQFDLHPALSVEQALGAARELAVAAAEWEATITAATRPRPDRRLRAARLPKTCP